MSDCPVGCGWWYDPFAEPVCAKPVWASARPVLWDGGLRVASAVEAVNPRPAAVGAHMCFAHPLDPSVLLLGPVVRWNPFVGVLAP